MNNNKLVITSKNIIYLTIFIWSMSSLFAYCTHFGDNFEFRIVAIISRQLIRLACILCILLRKNTKKELLKSFVLIFLAEITNYYAKTNFFVVILYLFAAGKNLDENKIIKTILLSNIIVFLVTTLFSLIGFLPTMVYVPQIGISRYTLGFATANTGPIILFQIAAAMWVVSKRHLWCLLIAVFSFLVSFYLCYSRTGAIISLSLALAECIWWLTVSQKSKMVKSIIWRTVHIMTVVVSMLVLVSFIIASQSSELLSTYNQLFSGRFVAMQNYFIFYTPRLFGQKIAFGDEEFFRYGMSTLDNSYVHLLLAYGIVLFVLYMLYFKRVIVYLIKNNLTKELIILILYTLYGFSETVAIRFLVNFSLIYCNSILWSRNTQMFEKQSVDTVGEANRVL